MQDSKVYSSILQTQENFTKRLRRDKRINQKVANKQRLEKIMETLKDVAENSDDVQNNHTPMEICNMMLEKVDLEKAQSVLVIYNVELLFALRKAKYQGQVTFFTQSLAKKEWAEKLLPGVVVEYIDKEENPLYFMETQWPDKFDIVVANPPYSKYLHIKFLLKSFEVAKEKIVFVHPSNSFINLKGGNKTYTNFNESSRNKLDEITLFNGNGIFGINLKTPCSISVFSPNGGVKKIKVQNLITEEEYFVDSINKITHFRNSPAFWSFKNKIDKSVKKSGSLDDILCKKSSGEYMVEFSRIRGNHYVGEINEKIVKDDFYTFVDKKLEVQKKNKSKYDLWFSFKDETTAINFLSYLKTDFARASLAIYKFAQSLNNGELRFVPKLDFTQEWTDEKLYAHFGITEEEQAFIKEVIPPYYD